MKMRLMAAVGLVPFLASAVDYDLNGDGVVDRLDYNLLAARIASTTAGYDSRYDLDGNGSIDAVDANILLGNMTVQTYTVNGVSFKMVAVEGGTFIMGATAEQGDDVFADSNEKPTHQVILSSFCIGQTEVTQELWQAVMGSNPSYFKASTNSNYGTNLQRPVERVNWNDCQTFITKLNQMTGMYFRLPTEAEWEYAARGGNKSRGYKYAGSDNISEVAWYHNNLPSTTSGTAGYGTQTVGTKAPNELGLNDMSGNVREWCQDWYGNYGGDAQTNPLGPESGTKRVNRSGSYVHYPVGCRVPVRTADEATYSEIDLGLRLAL